MERTGECICLKSHHTLQTAETSSIALYLVAITCGCLQKKETSQKVDSYLTIPSSESLVIFSHSQLAWTDAANYEAALQIPQEGAGILPWGN